MKGKNLIKVGLFIFIVIFLCAYFVEMSGYYEYNLNNKHNLTEEQIKKFESDVREGRDISIDDYLEDNSVDYSNKLTKVTCKFSLKVNDYLKNTIKSIFKRVNKMVEE